jgi:hypothetical protein
VANKKEYLLFFFSFQADYYSLNCSKCFLLSFTFVTSEEEQISAAPDAIINNAIAIVHYYIRA